MTTKDSDANESLSEDCLNAAAECLRVLAHPHRLQMIQWLLKGPQSVGEIAAFCQIAPHVASEHLRLMQRCHFLKAVRQGKFVYYEVIEPHLAPLMDCIRARFQPSQLLNNKPTLIKENEVFS